MEEWNSKFRYLKLYLGVENRWLNFKNQEFILEKGVVEMVSIQLNNYAYH
jgi:hypothetical protein